MCEGQSDLTGCKSQREQSHDNDTDVPQHRSKRTRRGDRHPASGTSQQIRTSARAKAKGKQKATTLLPPQTTYRPARRPTPNPLSPSEIAQYSQRNAAPLVNGPRAPVPDMGLGITEADRAPGENGNPANQGGSDEDAVMVCSSSFTFMRAPQLLVPLVPLHFI